MKTIIYTSFPCIIKLNNLQENLTQNENLEIVEDFEKISVYPIEKGRISFEINVQEKETSFYRIIERNGKRLIFLIDGLYAENADIYPLEYNGIKTKIEVYPQKVVFSGIESKKIVHLNQKYKSFKCGNFKFINYCLLANISGDSTLIAYNTKKNTAKVFNAQEINLDIDGWTLVNTAFGYTSITQHLYVDDEGLKTRKKDFISSSLSCPEETLPYQLLSAIKFGDYEKGLSMLAPELKDRLNSESLKAYFGNISYFYMLSPLSAYAIADNKNIVFEFQVKDKKITEISSE